MSSNLPLPRLRKMVELTLEENPKWRGVEVRNSDVALTVVIWQRWYNVSTKDDGVIHLYRLLDLPREDNVKRYRAKFQNEMHLYLPTNPEVARKRGIAREAWEKSLGYKLTDEEWDTHHKTASEFTLKKDYGLSKGDKVDLKGFGDDELTATVADVQDGPNGSTNVSLTAPLKKAYMVFKGHDSYGNYKTGQGYDLEMERLEVGRPIEIVKPHPRTYQTIEQFNKNWSHAL